MRKSIFIIFIVLGTLLSSTEVVYLSGELRQSEIDNIISFYGANEEITIVINKKIELVESIVTIAKDTTLRFERGGVIDLKSGDLLIEGGIEAGIFQIFNESGIGKVKGQTIWNNLDSSDKDYKYKGQINIDKIIPQWWGAKGDGYVDDTKAIQSAIDFGESVMPRINDRFISGTTIFFPKGIYKVSNTISINRSDIGIKGESITSTVIKVEADETYQPFDIFEFKGTRNYALYRNSLSDLTFYMPGNSYDKANIRATNIIDFNFKNIVSYGWFDGIVMEGCGRGILSNIIFSPEYRTSGKNRYAIDFSGTVTEYINDDNELVKVLQGCSDIHISDCNIVPNDTYRGDYALSIRNIDGIYFSNSHINGGVIIQPDDLIIDKVVEYPGTCATALFSNVYFDVANENNLVFTGYAENYRNFQFNNCYFAGAKNGVLFNDETKKYKKSTIENIQFSNCLFSWQKYHGISIQNDKVKNLTISNSTFSNNNLEKSIWSRDLIISGSSVIVSNCTFSGEPEYSKDYNILITSDAINTLITNNNFGNSSAKYKIDNSYGSYNTKIVDNL